MHIIITLMSLSYIPRVYICQYFKSKIMFTNKLKLKTEDRS